MDAISEGFQGHITSPQSTAPTTPLSRPSLSASARRGRFVRYKIELF